MTDMPPITLLPARNVADGSISTEPKHLRNVRLSALH